MPNTNTNQQEDVLAGLGNDDEAGMAYAATNAYLEWINRSSKVRSALHTLEDCISSNVSPEVEAKKGELADVIAKIEAAEQADHSSTKNIFERVNELDIELTIRAENLRDDIQKSCVTTTAEDKATSANSVNKVLLVGGGGILLLSAVLILSRLESFKNMTSYWVGAASACPGYLKSRLPFFNKQDTAIATDDVENVEQTQLIINSN